MKKIGFIIGFLVFGLTIQAQRIDVSAILEQADKELNWYKKDKSKQELRRAIRDVEELCEYYESLDYNSSQDVLRFRTWYLAARVYCAAFFDPTFADGNYKEKYEKALQHCNDLADGNKYKSKSFKHQINELEFSYCTKLNNSGNCAEAVKKAEKILSYYKSKDDTGKVLELERIIEDCGTNNQGESSSGNIVRGNKRYNGEFSIAGVGFSTGNGKKVGNAQYDYKDAPDGTRIFEGNFSYTYNTSSASDVVKGNYLNNKQVGTWKWISILKGYSESKKEEVTINFNDNGKLDGTFAYSYGLFGEYMGGHKWTSGKKSVSGDFANGKLKRLRYWSIENKVTAEGYYSTIDEGTPVGKWEITGEDIPNGSVTIEFDNRGNLIKNTYIDPTTGDKRYVHEWIYRYPKSIYKEAISLIRGYCYRDTERPKQY